MATASYPYPVLGHDDDVDSPWGVENFTVEQLPDYLGIEFDLNETDEDLKNAVDAKKAALFVRFTCLATKYSELQNLSEMHPFLTGHYSCEIDQRNISGPVEVMVFAAAIEDIPAWKWKKQHPDYPDAPFPIRRGEFLTTPAEYMASADKAYDPAQPPAGSIIEAIPIDTMKDTDPISINFQENEHIVLECSPNAYHMLVRESETRPNLVLSAYLLPALVEAIGVARDADEEDSREWITTLQNILKFEGLDDEDSTFIAAQKILQRPIYQGFEDLENED